MTVEGLSPVVLVSSWLRFADVVGDENSWDCHMYGSRQEAVENVVANAWGVSEAVEKVWYSHPQPMDLVLSNGLTVQMTDFGGGHVGEGGAPYLGEIFWVRVTVSPTVGELRSAPRAKESLRQEFRPYSAR